MKDLAVQGTRLTAQCAGDNGTVAEPLIPLEPHIVRLERGCCWGL
jgi:hypothetical protein